MSRRWHLALECSSLGGSVALLEVDSAHSQHLLSQQILPANGGSVRTLAPAIEQLLRKWQLSTAQLQLISVTHGPGSFTGLRVGLATAKMISWAHQIPIAPVDTLAATAVRFAQDHGAEPRTASHPVRLVAAINAFRKQVFTSSWMLQTPGPNGLIQVQPSMVCDAEPWLEDPWLSNSQASPFDGPLWVTGTALDVYSHFQSRAIEVAPADLRQPLAVQVAELGWQIHRAGRSVSALQLSPNYIRASAAEEKRSAT